MSISYKSFAHYKIYNYDKPKVFLRKDYDICTCHRRDLLMNLGLSFLPEKPRGGFKAEYRFHARVSDRQTRETFFRDMCSDSDRIGDLIS